MYLKDCSIEKLMLIQPGLLQGLLNQQTHHALCRDSQQMRVKSHSGARQHTPALIGWSIRGSVTHTLCEDSRATAGASARCVLADEHNYGQSATIFPALQ